MDSGDDAELSRRWRSCARAGRRRHESQSKVILPGKRLHTVDPNRLLRSPHQCRHPRPVLTCLPLHLGRPTWRRGYSIQDQQASPCPTSRQQQGADYSLVATCVNECATDELVRMQSAKMHLTETTLRLRKRLPHIEPEIDEAEGAEKEVSQR